MCGGDGRLQLTTAMSWLMLSLWATGLFGRLGVVPEDGEQARCYSEVSARGIKNLIFLFLVSYF